MTKTISEVKEIGWSALVERLGASGATLFILEYEKGYGDYTKDRRKILSEKDESASEALIKSIYMAKGKHIIQCCTSDGFLYKDWFKSCVEILDN